MNRLTDRERKTLMDYMCSFDEHVPCAGIFRHDPADKGVDLWGDMVMDIQGNLSMGGLGTTAAWMVHGHVPLKPHCKTFLCEVPERMSRPHCDERPPRPARRAEHSYGDLEEVKKVAVKVPVG